MNLSPQERRQRILERLPAGSVSVHDLVAEFGVSEITIRRDLALLEKEGRLQRVHGGAVSNERMAYEFSFKEKELRNRGAKEAIGAAAARLVAPGAAVFLDTGTTALAVARALRAARPGLIVTINLCVASEYVGQREIRVLVPGGEVGMLSPDLYGEWTLERLSDVTVDVAFLGCDRVDPTDGFYSTDTQSASVSRLMLRRSRRAYLIADSSKFGRRSMCRIAPLDRLGGVVSDSGLRARHRKLIKRSGLDLIVAGDKKKRVRKDG